MAMPQAAPLYFLVLSVLGILVAFCILLIPAFAEPMAERPSPVSHTRAIVESVYIVSATGNAGNVPIAHVRTVSDSLSVSAAFSQPASPQNVYRSYASPSAGQQRTEERTTAQTSKQRTNQNAGTLIFRNTAATPIIILGPHDTGPHDGGGEDPPDDSDVTYRLMSEKSIAASSYSAMAYGAMGVAVIVLSARNSGALGFVAARRHYVLTSVGSYASSRYAALGRGTRIIVLTGFATVAAASLSGAGDVVGAFADSPAGIAYRIGTSGGLGYREWDPVTSSWSSEASLTSAGSQLEVVRFLYSPTTGSELRVIGVRETNGEIDIYYCTANCTNAANWNGPNLVVDMGSPTGGRKYFDMAFEHASGDLLIVYTRTTTTETNDFFYQVFDSDTLTLSSESGFDYIADGTANNDIRFFQMASKPGSDEIAMALLDATNNDLVAFIWNGSSFGNQLTVTDTVLTASLAGESFNVAYESSSGAALVVGPGLATNELRYARYAGSWSSVSTLAGGINPAITTDDPTWMTLKPDPNTSSNKVMACATDDASDFSCVQFDAGTPGTPIRQESATGGSTSRRGDFAWVGWNSTGLALWYDNGASSYQSSRWNSPTATWSTETSGAVAQNFFWVTGVADQDSTTNGVDSLWAFYSQATTDDVGDGKYDSTTFTLNGLGTISADAGTANTDDVVSLDSRRPRSLSRSASDSVTLTDGITAKITGRGVPDSLQVSDSISRVYLQPRSPSDSVALSVSISVSVFSPGHAKPSEIVPIADSINTTVSRSISDTLSASDSVSKTVIKPLSDSVAITDSAAIHVTKVVADVLTAADSAARVLLAPRSVPDTVTITDSIPSDSNPAGMAYRSNTGSGASFPKYREWNPRTFAWGTEVELPDAGSPVRFAWIEFSPVSSKRVIVTLSDDGFLDSYACDDLCTQTSSWTVQNNVAQVRTVLSGIERPFDMEFEKTSGDLMLVYDKVSTDASQDLFYRIMTDSSSTFGSESSINDTTSVNTDVSYSFIRMDSRKTSGSDAIGMIALDATNSDAMAWVWDGSSWGNEHELTGAASITTRKAIDIAYESSSGNLMVAAGEGTAVRYNRFTTSWQTSSTATGTWGVGTINWVKLVPNPLSASNEIFLGAVGSLSDLDSAYWDGSSWTDHVEHDAGLGSIAGASFDFAWSGDSSSGILVWGTTAGQLDFKRFTAPNTFSSQGSFVENGSHNWVQMITNPTTTDRVKVLGATIDTTNDIGGIRWDGGTSNPVSTGDNAITTVGLDTYESFRVDFQKAQRITKPVADTITVGVSVSRTLVAVRTISDTVTLADDPRAHIPTPFTESLAIGDSIAKSVSKAMSDSVAPTESVNIQFEGRTSVSVSDTTSFTDSISRLRVSPAAISDSVTVSDTLSINIKRSPSDSLTVSDTTSREKASATSSSRAGAAYRSDTGTNLLLSPKYREWDPSTQTWSPEVELPSTGSAVRDAKVLFSPSSSLRVIVSLSADGSLNLFKCDVSCTTASNWTHVGGTSFANVGTLSSTNPYRPFDIAFEQGTGRLLIAYDKGLTENADFYYRTFYGATLSAESGYSYAGSTADTEEVRYFRMASKSASNEIAMIIQDATNANSYALIWNGSSFGNQLTVSTSIGSAGLDGGSIGVAYETASGSAMVFSASGVNTVAYARWSGDSWSSVSTTDPNIPSGANNMKFVRLATNPAAGSNKIMVCQADDVSDLSCAEINAGVLGTWTIHDTGITTTARRPFDFAWNPSGSGGLLVWGTSAGSISYSVYDGSAWGAEQTVSSAGTKQWVVGATSPSPDDVVNSLFLVLNSNLDIGTFKSKFNTLTLLGESTHTADTGVNTFEAMSIDFQKSSKVNMFISDTVATADATSKSVLKSVSDSLATTDASARIYLSARSISDNLTVEDAAATTYHPARSMADTVAVSDSAARTLSASRSVTDITTIEDAITRVPNRSVSDSLPLTDAMSKAVTKLVSDSVAVTDVISTKVTRSISDTVTATDEARGSASRSISDSISVTDAAASRITRSVSDSVAIADAITKIVTKQMTDSTSIADAVTGKVSALSVADAISPADAIAIEVTRHVSDSLPLTDAMSKAVTKLVSDSVVVEDAVSKFTTRMTEDSVSVTDSISYKATRSLSETIIASDIVESKQDKSRSMSEITSIQDKVSVKTSRSVLDIVTVDDKVSAVKSSSREIADSLAVSDSAVGTPTKTVKDLLTLQDTVLISVTKVIADSLVPADAVERTAGHTRFVSDAITLVDSVDGKKTIVISDSLTLSDTINVPRTVHIDDSLGLADEISFKPSNLRFDDPLAVTDAIGITITIPVTDSIGVTDLLEGTRTINIHDSIGVNIALTDVSWSRTIALGEGLGLSSHSCTPAECQLNLHVHESLALQDEWVPPPSLEDAAQIVDIVSASKRTAKQLSDTLVAKDKADFRAKFAPPPGVALNAMVATNAAIVEPPAATPVTGTFSMSGGVDKLASDLNIQSVDVTGILAAQTTLVLPSYSVSLTPTAQVPTDVTMMTVKVATIPANTPVMVPINIASTPQTSKHEQIPWMKVEYTPQVSSTDFALVTTPLESPPGGIPEPLADLAPLYLDIRWVGAFPAGTSPAASNYYSSPPTFTFAVTDAWVDAQGAERDANGAPLISLNLLDEATKRWIPISTVDRPTGATDGQYVFVAHLEHFSTYAVTANKAAAIGRTLPPPLPPPTLTSAQLDDSINVGDAPKSQVIEIIEEFVKGKSVTVRLSDQLRVVVKPVAYGETLQVGRDVTVAIALDDVYSASILPPEARAVIILEVENRGDQTERFQLNMRYVDQSGRVAYDSSEDIRIGPHESSQKVVEVPFNSAGDFVISLDARAEDDHLLGTAQIEVTVPWLAVNIYVIVAAVAAILAGTGITLVYILRRPKTGYELAG